MEIIGLRDEWGLVKLKELIKNLRQFKSPFAMDDNFKIIIDAPELGYSNYIISSEKLEGISSLWIDVECKKSNTDIVFMTVCKDGIEYEEKAVNKYNIGPMRMKVYFFNQGDKVRFKNRFAIRVRDFGNIRLYRDEFRIHPYGEANNDWLDIDRRMAQGYSRFFGSRDLIGYVQTYKRYNQGCDMPDSHRFAKHKKETEKRFRKMIFEEECNKNLSKVLLDKYGVKKNCISILDKNLASPTITTHPDDHIHYEEPRILTVREYARLQSFPDDFEFKGKYTTGGKRRKVEVPRYTQVGNAIPPLFAEQVGIALKKYMEKYGIKNDDVKYN